MLETIKAVIEAAGGTMADVTFNHIFLTDWADYAAINAVYAEYFPGDKPARYCIQCGLVKPDALVEIASVAHIGKMPSCLLRPRERGPADARDRSCSRRASAARRATGRRNSRRSSERYRVVTYDQRGTGRSERRRRTDHSIAAMADEVLAVLERRRPTTAALRRPRARRPGRPRLAHRHRSASLVVVNGWAAAHAHTALLRRCGWRCSSTSGPPLIVRAQPIFLYPADWLAKNAERAAQEEAHGLAGFQGADTLRRAHRGVVGIRRAPHLGASRVPTLISAARDDVLVPCSMSEQLAAGITERRPDIAPWGAHAINVTQPDAFNASLLGFLDSH